MSNAQSSIWSTPAAPQYGFHDFHASEPNGQSRQQYFSTFSPQLNQRSLPNSTPDITSYIDQSPQLYQNSFYPYTSYGIQGGNMTADSCLKKAKSSPSPPNLRTNSADTYFMGQYPQDLSQSQSHPYDPYSAGQSYYAQTFMDSQSLMNIMPNTSNAAHYTSSPTLEFAPHTISSGVATDLKSSKFSPLYASSTSLECSLPSPNANPKLGTVRPINPATGKPRRAPKNPQAAHILPGASGFYECEQCPQKFRRKFCYQRHLLMHGDDRLFQCSACQMNFYRKDIFERHRKTKKCLRAQTRQ